MDGEHDPSSREISTDELYRLIAETIPHMVWTTRPDGFHDYFNSRWESYIGKTAQATKGHAWHTFVHPDDQERAQKVWARSLASGESYEVEYRFRRHDGVYRWFLGRAEPIRNTSGQILKWFGTCTDIEERKRALEERAKLLAREREAREAAEAASRAREDLLARVSHELRTPLAAIMGWVRLLLAGMRDSAGNQAGLETIERNARILSKLVDDLVDAASAAAGRIRLEKGRFDLALIAASAAESFREQIAEKNLALRLELDCHAECLVDETRIQEVLYNLIHNSIKFTQDGAITISLAMDGDDAVLRVHDTGQGVSPEFMPSLFERFKVAGLPADCTKEGLGLGLSIAHSIVELHGGSISASSPGVGKGTTVEVRLPLYRPNVDGDHEGGNAS